ncbi:MAG: SDR family oxidoreductase [Pseudomonadota bacterium]
MTDAGSVNSLKGRVILITGGSRGLGREMALALAEAGAKLCITGASDSAALDQTAGDLGARTGPDNVVSIAADVADPGACNSAVAACVDRFGRVDVLINNAGLGMRVISEAFTTQPSKFWQADTDAWRRLVDTNTNGPFQMAKAVVPLMLEAGFGKIINVSTSDQTMVRKGYAPYGPSKAFLEAASRIWAADLQGTGITVNVLLPGGATDTDMLPPGPGRKGADGNLLDPVIMRQPILFLASDASNGMTGGRYIARLWDGPDAARDTSIEKPKIM